MESIIYRRIPRPPREVIRAALRSSVADLLESMIPTDWRSCLMGSAMRPLVPGLRIAGPAVTAWNHPGDNSMIHVALHLAARGDVLVFTAGGGAEGPQWGDLSCTYAIRKRIAGVIVDGSIRDSAFMLRHRFPVWATSISASHPTKERPGGVNVPIMCCGAAVEPGDLIVADHDGVLVVPLDKVNEVVAAAASRRSNESRIRKAVRQGASLYELLRYDQILKGLGVRQVGGAWRDEMGRREPLGEQR